MLSRALEWVFLRIFCLKIPAKWECIFPEKLNLTVPF